MRLRLRMKLASSEVGGSAFSNPLFSLMSSTISISVMLAGRPRPESEVSLTELEMSDRQDLRSLSLCDLVFGREGVCLSF